MARENVILSVRPVHDLTTEVLADKLAKKAIDLAKARLYTVYDLYNFHANRPEYEVKVPIRDPKLLFCFSHGVEDGLIGDDGLTPYLDIHNNFTTIGRICYFCACHTGKKLAPASVEAGALACLAWDDTLTITIDARTREPLEGFRQVLVEKPCLLYEGYTVQATHAETIKEYEKWIEYWDERDPHVADVLRHDRDHFKLYGTGESRITLSPWLLIGLTDVFAVTTIILIAVLGIVRRLRRR